VIGFNLVCGGEGVNPSKIDTVAGLYSETGNGSYRGSSLDIEGHLIAAVIVEALEGVDEFFFGGTFF
jgi:hypothetical protein